MELPRRQCGDELLKPGEMARVLASLRRLSKQHDISSVIVSAFDFHTRMLPLIWAGVRMVPGGARAIGSAMWEAGFHRTRIVLQQWNPNFRPSRMQLDGACPDVFMVSSMMLNWAQGRRLIEDACRIEPSRRPLIIVGGPKMFYEPWEAFSADPENPAGADVVVTGEEYVLLSLLEVLLSVRADGEPMRSVFARARDSGALDEIPGLVYAKPSPRGHAEELVDTGVQRLLADLDELPSAVHGFALLETPSREQTLGFRPLPEDQVRKHCRIASAVLTLGCRFHCYYCPIPAYNQRYYRSKSGQCAAEEMEQIAWRFGIRRFYGSDDNFFNDEKRTLEITEAMARLAASQMGPMCKVRWGTEATVHDVLRLKEHLPAIRRSGLTALWLGVEDITATLVSKGQSKDRTLEALDALRTNGIFPVPMLMHHDSQPLYSLRGHYGLLNQLRLLRKAGSVYVHILMLMPQPGSRTYEQMYESKMVFCRVGGRDIQPYEWDAVHVIASTHPRPWVKQLNIFVGYIYFFNPLRLLAALIWPCTTIPLADAETTPPYLLQQYSRLKRIYRRIEHKVGVHCGDALVQAYGMWGMYHTLRRMCGWTWRLFRGRIERAEGAPASPIAMRGAAGGPAAHAIPGTPGPQQADMAPSASA